MKTGGVVGTCVSHWRKVVKIHNKCLNTHTICGTVFRIHTSFGELKELRKMIKTTILSSSCDDHVVTIHDKKGIYGNESYQLRICGGQRVHRFHLAISIMFLVRTIIVCSDVQNVLHYAFLRKSTAYL